MCIGIDPSPSLRSSPAGKTFTGGKPSGEGRYTASQGLVLWSWTHDTLFLLVARYWGYIFQVYSLRNKYMGTYFMFSCIYAISIDVGRFRGSNKWGNLFIYTSKYVLNTIEHFPIKGAKMRKCSVPYPILKGPWRRSRHTNEPKKRFIILYYTFIYQTTTYMQGGTYCGVVVKLQ
jgi:hypothetical protein